MLHYVLPAAKWRALPHPDGESIIQEFVLPEGQIVQLRCPRAAVPMMVTKLNELMTSSSSSASH